MKADFYRGRGGGGRVEFIQTSLTLQVRTAQEKKFTKPKSDLQDKTRENFDDKAFIIVKKMSCIGY